MRRLFLVGSGPSLSELTTDERYRLSYTPTLATSSFVLWDQAWEPTYYLVNDAADALPEADAFCSRVDKRWPGTQKLIETLVEEYRPRLGWTWFERNHEKSLTARSQRSSPSRQWLSSPTLAPCSNPLWYAVQVAVLLGYDNLVLLGAEHTDMGYVHSPQEAHVRNLAASRYEAEVLYEECRRRGVRLVDASGPTSTLRLPCVAISDELTDIGWHLMAS